MARIKDLMSKHMVAVSKNASVASALKLMKQARVSVLPVVEGDVLAGLLMKEDMGEDLGELKVADFKLRRIFVELEDTPEKAAKIMVEHKVNRLPVVNNSSEMKCVGIVTSTEIAKSHKKKIF